MKYIYGLMSILISIACTAQTNIQNFPKTAPAEQMLKAVNRFIATLDQARKDKIFYSFSDSERYDWHYVPLDHRRGIPLNELTPAQKDAALELLKTGLSKDAYEKAIAITQLENVLKVLEHHPPEDHFRDPGKYFFTLFGKPSSNEVWGWRVEGHHVSFNFTSENNRVISGTPGFLGSNPAIVLSGPEKGKQVLKEESDDAFLLLHSLTSDQLKKTMIDTTAPNDIITYVSRRAMIENPAGISYNDLNSKQKSLLMDLVLVYIHRYTKLFADDMLQELKDAGLERLRFAWAGAHNPRLGAPHYYRITGPTIIIEYDNSQNNANHVHSVVRDLKRDFGGDELLEHYLKDHNARVK